MIRSLKINQTVVFRDLDKILKIYKLALSPTLLERLSIVLHNLNPIKFNGYVTTEERREAREYGNYNSIKKNLEKVEKTINKEERNNFLVVLPY
jgi:hypothetical protein